MEKKVELETVVVNAEGDLAWQTESRGEAEPMAVDVKATPSVISQSPMVIDVGSLFPEGAQQPTTPALEGSTKVKRKYVKRKRALINGSGGIEDKAAFLATCKQELDELFCYFRETLARKLDETGDGNGTNESLVACLMEGSSLSLSKLAEEMYERLKSNEGVTVQSLIRDLLFVGSRIKYGFDNGNLNIGEDESKDCLWCWEARDINLLPKNQRRIYKCFRMARKKVHARLDALSAIIAVLSRSEGEDTSYLKALEKLDQEWSLSEIQSFVEKSLQKTNANMSEGKAKPKEKELVKEIEKNKHSEEKEKKRKELEAQKENAQSERELKRVKEEAGKEERRRQKQEAEIQKQIKRHHEEARKDKKRQEKEEIERKRQISTQKQATIMERFLKKSQINTQEDGVAKLSTNISSPDSSKKSPDSLKMVISSMDHAFSQEDLLTTTELWRTHLSSWRKLCHLNRSQHWGVRQGKKTDIIKGLKLHGSSQMPMPSEKVHIANKGYLCSVVAPAADSITDKISDENHTIIEIPDCNDDVVAPSVAESLKKTIKLLQFDKSHRPAYYGTWSKRSSVVQPRHPLARDPDLDYDVDSDEEWEEEEPGESLTDCDKDDEEEDCQDLKSDADEESEDGFFVPDGYLSENEGAQEDEISSEAVDDETNSLTNNAEMENEEFRLFLQRQKHLNSLTDKALRKSRPLIISNLMHEKSGLVMSSDACELAKTEMLCIQTLCMQALHGSSVIELPVGNLQEEDQAICSSQTMTNISQGSFPAPISVSDLPEFVKSIQTHCQGMSKVIESLQQKFPVLSKLQIRNKVKEISDFVDNRWQVKKDVLCSLGLSASPGKPAKLKGIASFFSKRCLPPAGETIIVPDSSPLRRPKTEDTSPNNAHNCPERLG